MPEKFESVEQYIESLPDERKEAVQKLRELIKSNLPEGFEEGIQYNMIGYYVPHSKYPKGYHVDPKEPLPFLNVASQKSHIALYHSAVYSHPGLHKWFVEEYPKHAKVKLDMGKSCIRFKKPAHIPYELIGELCTKITPDEWIEIYESNLPENKK